MLVSALVLAGCGEGSDGEAQTTTASTSTPASASSAPEAKEGELTLRSGELVHYRCVGDGAPAILLEAGTDSGGTDSLPPAFIQPLAEAVRVCTYDRLGTGLSDPAPDRKRTIDDLCDVQDEVRDRLRLTEPTVLAGQSGGANLVIWCASRRPASVAALVSIEGYHDDPADLAAEGFTWRENPEHVDWVESSMLLDEMSMPIGKFPVLVITATDSGPRGATNQKYWLALSTRSRQVVMQGGHDLHEEIPDQVSAEILKELPNSSASGRSTRGNGQIVFRRYFNAVQTKGALFVINPDGRHVRQITEPPNGWKDNVPAWSPDGKRITFERFKADESTSKIIDTSRHVRGLGFLSHPAVA